MKKLCIVLAACLLLCGCSTNPVTNTTQPMVTTELPTENAQPQSHTMSVIGADVDVITLNYYTKVRAQWGPPGADTGASPHPLMCASLFEKGVSQKDVLELSFSIEPDQVTICRWRDEAFGDPKAVAETVAVVEDGGYLISLNIGAWVYSVTAVWESEDGTVSVGHYAFLIGYNEIDPH